MNHIVPALQFQLRQRKSNLTMVLEYLKELGYSCCARKLKSSDYGLPQRRSRYYIFGFRSSVDFAQSASALAELTPSRLQTMASSECSPVAEVPDFFLPSPSNSVYKLVSFAMFATCKCGEAFVALLIFFPRQASFMSQGRLPPA